MSESVYFQDVEIDWRKAKQEHSLKKVSPEELATFLYVKQLRQLVDSIRETINSLEDNDQSNKIFSVVGERGTGKSSFLRSFSEVMKADKSTALKADFKDIPNMYILPKIDPILFDQSITIIEMLASMLDKEVTDKEKELSKNHFENNTLQLFVDFKKCLREVINILKNICKGESYFAKKDSGIEVLKEIKERQNFEEKIGEMIEKFLAIMRLGGENYAGLLIRIDDLDLVTNKRIYHALNDLFKFVGNQKNVIVVMAYREEQLNNSVIDNLLADNQELLKQSFISQIELKRQAAKFLEKGLPKSNRLYLSIDEDTDIDLILRPYIKSKDTKKFDEIKENQTVFQFIQNQVMKTTKIMIDPIDSLENTSMTYPKSIRSTLQYLEKLHQLEKLNRKINIKTLRDDKKKYFETIIENLNNYQEFLYSIFRENLINQDFYILSEWLNRNIESRNSYFVVTLGEKIEEKIREEKSFKAKYLGHTDKDKELSSDIVELLRVNQICEKQTYNITLGDVYEIMECYKDYFKGSEGELYFIYAAKILYSIENLRLFLKSLLEAINQENRLKLNSTDEDDLFESNVEIWGHIFDEYLSLVHGKIMMDEYYYERNILSNNRDKVNYQFYLPTKNEDFDFDIKILSKVVISSTPSYGDVSQSLNESTVTLGHDRRSYSFQYRFQFQKYNVIDNLGSDSLYANFKKNSSYGIDPYSFLTDIRYLSQATISILREAGNNRQKYFFYSMFDLDFFIRKNYQRNGMNELRDRMAYVLRRINDAITGGKKKKSNTVEELKMREKMSGTLFDYEINRDYEEPFSKDFIFNYCSEKYFPSKKKDQNQLELKDSSIKINVPQTIKIDDFLGEELTMSDEPYDKYSGMYLFKWTYVNQPRIWNEFSNFEKNDLLKFFEIPRSQYTDRRRSLGAELWNKLIDNDLVIDNEK